MIKRKFIGEDMRKKVNLVMKVVLFAFILVWDLLFLAFALTFFFTEVTTRFPNAGLYALLPTWYLVTVILFAVAVAYYGLRRVGRWERSTTTEEEVTESIENEDSKD